MSKCPAAQTRATRICATRGSVQLKPSAPLIRYSAPRGEDGFERFVQASINAARFRGEELIDDLDYYAALEALSDATAASRPALCMSALGLGPSPLAFGDWLWDGTGTG